MNRETLDRTLTISTWTRVLSRSLFLRRLTNAKKMSRQRLPEVLGVMNRSLKFI
ncbi:hypothetical protein ACFW04_003559 [Cataglyphis niger]